MTMTSSRTGVIVSKVKFTLDPPSQANLIRSYSDTELRIGEQRVQRSCLVTAGQLITDWPPRTFDELAPAHLETIFALAPELVLLGTGPRQRFASAQVRSEFARRRIGLEVMQLGAACRTFNVLVQEDRRVLAALFLR
jgi:uncharacterized protein